MASTFRNAVLRATYTSYFTSKKISVGLKNLAQEHALDDMTFDQEVEKLTTARYIQPMTAGHFYKITLTGIEYVEANKLVDRELVDNIQRTRATILAYLRQRHESGEANGRAILEQIIGDNNLEAKLALRNLYVLLDQGSVRESSKAYQITT